MTANRGKSGGGGWRSVCLFVKEGKGEDRGDL